MATKTIVGHQKITDFYEFLKSHPLAYPSSDFIITMITILILFFLCFRPMLLTIISLQKKITDLELLNQNLTKKRTDLERLKVQYQEIQSYLPLINKAIPSKPEVTLLDRELNYFINLHKLTFVSISFTDFPIMKRSNINQSSPLNLSTSEEEFNLSVTGEYNDVKSFISDIENDSRIINLTDTKLSAIQKDGEISSNITGKVYYIE